MRPRKRRQVEPTEDWQQLRLLAPWPEQVTYELIRPVVLFGRSPAERAKETGASQRTLHRKADRFDERGMASLFAPEEPAARRALPAQQRRLIHAVKAEWPAMHLRELARICYAQSGRRPSHHTVQQILADRPTPLHLVRRFPPFARIPDPVERRRAILTLHSEGWRVTTIAAYLETTRDTVYDTLRRWIEEREAGLPDKSHARKPGPRKADLHAIATVRKLQENPELGEFRMHAALKQQGIHLSPRTCGRILALNRRLYGLPTPSRAPHAPREMPFKATRRHEYWTVDVRELDTPSYPGGQVYVISILENFSRAILASNLSLTQDLTAYLAVLYAAMRQHGSPEALVSDGGAVFKAKQAMAIYRALGIAKERIDQGQAWQSYIETHFNVQRRMADHQFAKAATWTELRAAHDRWVADYNFQDHWAHRERQDDRRSPADVLGWVGGVAWRPDELDRIFRTTRFGRLVDRAGYVRFRHWRIYGERGVAKRRATVWLYGETLTLEFADEALAQYTVEYQPDRTHFRQIGAPRLFETSHRSPQLTLWELSDAEWHKVMRLPSYAPRRRRPDAVAVQQPLFP